MVLKTCPYCLHSKEPEWVAFPVGSLSWKGKDSINNVTELPFNISEMVTEQKGTLKELSRGHECFDCLCGVSSPNKGIWSQSLLPASFINFGEWLNAMFINLKCKMHENAHWYYCLLTHSGTMAPIFSACVQLPAVSFFLLRPAMSDIPESSFWAVFRLS